MTVATPPVQGTCIFTLLAVTAGDRHEAQQRNQEAHEIESQPYMTVHDRP